MSIFLTGVLVGVLGTLVMDVLNLLFSRTGLIHKIDVGSIGRMSAGWARGRFFFNHPSEMPDADRAVMLGYITHYAIGVALAYLYFIGWEMLVGGEPSTVWAIVYGVATTVVSYFYVFPSRGLGLCGWKSPDGIKSPLSSLFNHLFFGLGMALAILIV